MERRHIGSRKQRHKIAQGSSFLVPKSTVEIRTESPSTGKPNPGEVDEVGEFRQIGLTRHISKTVQDIRIVSIKDEQEVVYDYALSNGNIADDLQ